MAESMIRIEADDRYARLRLIPWWDQDRLKDARVLVIGAGAIGNETLKNLAMVGVGHLYVVDFDTIETSNLTRSILFREKDSGKPKAEVAARSIREINPDVNVTPIVGDVHYEVGLGLVASCDLAIGCLDNREARLWLNRAAWKVSIPWIDGGISEIRGAVKVYGPPAGPCYECTMTETDYKLLSRRYSCPLLKQEDILEGKVPTVSTSASIVGALQVQEALKLIHNLPSAVDHALVFDGHSNNFYKTRLPRREECLSHETYPEPIPVPLKASDATVSELIALAAKEFPDASPDDVAVLLDRELIIGLECPVCDLHKDLVRLMGTVGQKEGICPTCNGPMHPDLSHRLGVDGSTRQDLMDGTLRDVGIAPFDIVQVRVGQEDRFLLLEGDREANLK